MSKILAVILLTCAVSLHETTQETEDVPITCDDMLNLCKDDYANSKKKRYDVLLLIRCLNEANCEDDDAETRDKAVYVAKTNYLHYSPIDDKEEPNTSCPLAMYSTLALTISCYISLIFL